MRQLQRMLLAELGAGPIAIARAQRAQTARILIETTTLNMVEIAFAAGFSSVRQFNDTIRTVFATAPTELRARAQARRGWRELQSGGSHRGRLALWQGPAGRDPVAAPFRKPLCPDNLFGHLAATAVPGVEEVRDGAYRRTLHLPHGPGTVELTPTPEHIVCRARLADVRDLTTAIARCRWLLDLDADPVAIDELLNVTHSWARSWRERRDGECRAASTERSLRYARFWGNRSPRPQHVRMRPGSSPATASRSAMGRVGSRTSSLSPRR